MESPLPLPLEEAELLAAAAALLGVEEPSPLAALLADAAAEAEEKLPPPEPAPELPGLCSQVDENESLDSYRADMVQRASFQLQVLSFQASIRVKLKL